MHTLHGMQHGIRRWVWGALVVLVAASAALGTGHGASAGEDNVGYPIDGYISAEEFKQLCELYDGTFSTDPWGGTYCHYSDGSGTECDANGGDCWRTPARQLGPGVEQTYGGTAPVHDSSAASDATGRGDLLEPAPQDAAVVVVEEGTPPAPSGEQEASGPATSPGTELLALVADPMSAPDAHLVQEPMQEAGAVVAASVEE